MPGELPGGPGQEMELRKRVPAQRTGEHDALGSDLELHVDPDFGKKLTQHEGGESQPSTTVAVLERPQTSTELAVPESRENAIAVPEVKGNEDPLRIVLTSLDQNIDSFAREAAHEKLAKKPETKGWKRVVQSVWTNLTREYQLVKETTRARDEIRENENLLHHHGKSDAQWREAVVRRYESQYADMLSEGETRHDLTSPEAQRDPNAVRMREDTFDLLRRYAKGEIIDVDSLDMMQARMVEKWRDEGVSQQFIGEGEFLAHNIGNVAKQVKAALDNMDGLSELDRDAKLEEMLAKAEFVTGEARVGSRVEIEATMSEKLAERLRDVPFINEGRIARVTSMLGNEVVVAALVSAGIGVAKRGVSTATKIVAPGLGAGIVAAMRERRAMLDERALMARRLDSGQEIDQSSKAQVELGRTMYEARPATEIIDELGNFYDHETGDLTIRSREEFDQAMMLLADIQARDEIGDRDRGKGEKGARLISFEGVGTEQMEDMRFKLALGKAKLETDLRKLFGNPVAETMLTLQQDETFDDLSEAHIGMALGRLEGQMDDYDRTFSKIRAKRALAKGLGVGLMGATLGELTKEGVEAAKAGLESAASTAQSVSEYVHNLFTPSTSRMEAVSYAMQGNNGGGSVGVAPETSGSVGVAPEASGSVGVAPETSGSVGVHEATSGSVGVSHETSGSVGVAPEASGSVGVSAETAPSAASTHEVSHNSRLSFAENGYNATAENGQVTVTTPSGETITGLELNKDGSLSQSAMDTLQAHGLSVQEGAPETIQGKPEITHSKVTPAEFAHNHLKEMKKIHITKWFDNNTTRFDLNELGTDNSVKSNGDVTISIQRMTEGGSFHGRSGVDWKEAARDGHLKVYLSASEGSQAHAFEITINPDGTANIPSDSPARALFDDQGNFHGGFEQIALNGGESEDGTQNIAVLSTVVGDHTDTLTDTHITPTYETAHNYIISGSKTEIITPSLYSTPTTPFQGTPIVVGAAPRRNLGEAIPEPVIHEPITPRAPSTDIALREPVGQAVERVQQPKIDITVEPSRNPQAERFAEDRGLPSSQEAAAGNQQAGAPESATSPESDSGFTDREQDFLRQVDNETRNLPFPIEGLDLSKLSPRERKLATILAYEAMKYNAQKPGENIFDYRQRMRGIMATAAATSLPAGTSPAMQRLMRGAFDILTHMEGNGTESNPPEDTSSTTPGSQPGASAGTPEAGGTAATPPESSTSPAQESTANAGATNSNPPQGTQQNTPTQGQGGESQPESSAEQDQVLRSSDEMRELFAGAESEEREFPYELSSDRNINQYSPQAIKLATALVHLADNVQQRPNESPQDFAARKVAVAKSIAQRARGMLADIPRSEQGRYRMALDMVFNIKL